MRDDRADAEGVWIAADRVIPRRPVKDLPMM